MSQQNFITSLNTTEEGYIDYTPLLSKYESVYEPFEFEKIDFFGILHWGHKHWYISPIVGFIYIGVIFALQHWMKNRKAYDLKRELFWWNASLGIFSIVALVRLLPEYLNTMKGENGLYRSICVLEFSNHQIEFWSLLFAISKFVELGDTIFIVLRKKPLVVLQWYHHFITMIGACLMGPFLEPITRTFCVINYGVHSLMYPYFALRALDVKIPKKLANIITGLQFYQMVNNLSLICYTAFLYFTGVPCYRHPFPLALSFCIAVTFNILFGNLFYKSVILKGKKKV